MRSRIDWPSAKAALRTAGALMVGNVFVAGLLTPHPNWLGLALLLLAGGAVIMLTSLLAKPQPNPEK